LVKPFKIRGKEGFIEEKYLRKEFNFCPQKNLFLLIQYYNKFSLERKLLIDSKTSPLLSPLSMQ
jgi:hypothetical protein